MAAYDLLARTQQALGQPAEARAALAGDTGVVLIGDARLSDRYARALDAQGIASQSLDGDACARAGLGFLEN